MAHRIVLDKMRCIGAGECVLRAPLTFALDDAFHSTVVNPTGDPVAWILDAAQACPVNAITIMEDEQGLEP